MKERATYVILCWNGVAHIPYFCTGYRAAVKMYRYYQRIYGEYRVKMAQIIHDYGDII